MRMKYLWGLLACILVIVLLATACSKPTTTSAPAPAPAPAPASAFNWRYASGGDNDITYNFDVALAKLIQDGSGGRVKVTVYPLGQLATIENIASSIQSGAVEAGTAIPGFISGQAPSANTSELAYTARNINDLSDIFYKYGLGNVLRKEYADKAGIYFLGFQTPGQVKLMSTFELTKLSELKGKLIWVTPPQQVLTKFGGVYTDIPGGDRYMALKLGSVNALVLTDEQLESMHFKEVVKYVSSACQFYGTPNLMVNLKAWNALGADLQNKIQSNVDANIMALLNDVQKKNDAGKASAMAYGVKYSDLPAADEATLAAAARAGWDDLAKGSQGAADAIAVYRKWIKENNIP